MLVGDRAAPAPGPGRARASAHRRAAGRAHRGGRAAADHLPGPRPAARAGPGRRPGRGQGRPPAHAGRRRPRRASRPLRAARPAPGRGGGAAARAPWPRPLLRHARARARDRRHRRVLPDRAPAPRRRAGLRHGRHADRGGLHRAGRARGARSGPGRAYCCARATGRVRRDGGQRPLRVGPRPRRRDPPARGLPVEALDRCLAEVDRLNDTVNAVVWRDDAEAREQAQEAERVLGRTDPDLLPPFHGVPMPIKDLTAGGGLAGDLRLPRRRPRPQRAGRDRRGQVPRRRVRPRVPHEHARVRPHHGGREPPLRAHAQPLGPGPHAGRVQRRRRRRGGRGHVPDGPRQRRRRLDPHPRLVLRPRRSQAQPRARPPPGAVVAGRRRRGRRVLDRGRQRRGAGRHQRPRSAGLVQRARPRPPVRRGGGRRAGAAAHRPGGDGAARAAAGQRVRRRRARSPPGC